MRRVFRVYFIFFNERPQTEILLSPAYCDNYETSLEKLHSYHGVHSLDLLECRHISLKNISKKDYFLSKI